MISERILPKKYIFNITFLYISFHFLYFFNINLFLIHKTIYLKGKENLYFDKTTNLISSFNLLLILDRH